MYQYSDYKSYVLTDEGQRKLLAVRDFAFKALAISGAVRAQELLNAAGSGDSWSNMACIDCLVELSDIREIPTDGAWQHRVFVSGWRDV